MKKLLVLPLLLILASSAFAQTPTQIKQVLPTTPSVVVQWDFDPAQEINIDLFVLQRTSFDVASTITSPYDKEQPIAQKTVRSYTFLIPAPVTPGQKAFFRMVSRKTGLADSAPSNVVEVDVVATPPSPMNLRFPPQ